MKYSFMSFSCPEMSAGQMIGTAKLYGFDGVELRVEQKHAHGIELTASPRERAETRKLFEKSGVAIACVATSCCYGDPGARSGQVESTRKYIDLAADIGCGLIRVFGGQIGSASRRDGIAGVSDALLSVADHATRRGVIVCLETHDDWCDPAHVAAVIDKVNRDSVRVNWDIMHPVRTGAATMDGAYAALKGSVRHAHIHDCEAPGDNIRFAQPGKGIIDHKRALELLMADGADIFMSFEWIGMGPAAAHLPQGLAAMKAFEEEIRKERALK